MNRFGKGMNILCKIIYNSNSTKLFSRIYGQEHLKNVIGLNLRSSSTGKLKPFVGTPYSYAYGRSDKQLKYLRIGDLLNSRAQTDKNKIGFVSEYENISKTYSEINDDSNKLAKGLYDLGLRRGDVVGIWSCNSYAWVQVQYACAKLGVILCTVNPVYRAPELNYALRKGQIKAMFMPGEGSPQQVVNQYQKIFQESFGIKKDEESGDILLKDVIHLDGNLPKNGRKEDLKIHSFESLVKNDGIIEESVLSEVNSDDPAMIMFTSGTTGKPKGAYLSHFTLVNNTILSSDHYKYPNEDMTTCVPLPFFHAFAGVSANLAMTAVPVKEVIPSFRYDIRSIVNTINKHSCSHIIATPTIIIDMLNYLEGNKLQVNSLKAVGLGGASIYDEVFKRINRLIPSCTDVLIGYGATELGPNTTINDKTDTIEQKHTTVGSPLDFVEVKIVNTASGDITKIGERGELLSRGHNVMKGYWRDTQLTKESLDDRKWFKSGDLATMDENGFIKIIGRTKEMIIRGGENIYPREVEELLLTHPQVLQAYVVGVPDERTGEEVCAWVQLKDKNTKLSPEDIREFCKQNISYFKVPRYVLFVEGFPMTPTGKAQKFIMRDKSCQILGLKENK